MKLPPYIVRVSSRARRVRLVIKPGEGLTVVTPTGFDLGRVETLLVQRLDWIEKHLDPAWTTSDPPDRPALAEPPAEVRFAAVSRLVRVRYRADARAGVRVVGMKSGPGPFPVGDTTVLPGAGPAMATAEPPDASMALAEDAGSCPRPMAGANAGPGADHASGVRANATPDWSSLPAEVLEVRGDIADREGVAQALRSWLLREARAELSPWLARRAGELGLEYSGIGVRLQRTRWGSCSAKGVINLNAALLFLPRPLAAYVIDHELTHTCHLNHSPAYWALLETLHPGSRQADKAMRDARIHVPTWARRG